METHSVYDFAVGDEGLQDEILRRMVSDYFDQDAGLQTMGRNELTHTVGNAAVELELRLERTGLQGTAPVIALPQFAVDMLERRAQEERLNPHGLIFPSSRGTYRDPSGFARQWRTARAELGEPLSAVTGHSFRKTIGDLVAEHTADIRKTADVLGHSDVATTQKHYLSRGKPHPEIATMVNNTVRGKLRSTKRPTARRSRAFNTD